MCDALSGSPTSWLLTGFARGAAGAQHVGTLFVPKSDYFCPVG